MGKNKDKLGKIADEVDDVVDAVKDLFTDSESDVTEEPIGEPEPIEEPMTKAEPKPDTMTALVNSCTIRAGDIDAKRGDTIEIPTDPDKHTPALANAIKNGHIIIDLAPVISEDTE